MMVMMQLMIMQQMMMTIQINDHVDAADVDDAAADDDDDDNTTLHTGTCGASAEDTWLSETPCPCRPDGAALSALRYGAVPSPGSAG